MKREDSHIDMNPAELLHPEQRLTSKAYLTNALRKAGDCQVKISPDKPFGILSSMDRNDKTVVVMLFRKV